MRLHFVRHYGLLAIGRSTLKYQINNTNPQEGGLMSTLKNEQASEYVDVIAQAVIALLLVYTGIFLANQFFQWQGIGLIYGNSLLIVAFFAAVIVAATIEAKYSIYGPYEEDIRSRNEKRAFRVAKAVLFPLSTIEACVSIYKNRKIMKMIIQAYGEAAEIHLNLPHKMLDGKTPREIIKYGNIKELEKMLSIKKTRLVS